VTAGKSISREKKYSHPASKASRRMANKNKDFSCISPRCVARDGDRRAYEWGFAFCRGSPGSLILRGNARTGRSHGRSSPSGRRSQVCRSTSGTRCCHYCNLFRLLSRFGAFSGSNALFHSLLSEIGAFPGSNAAISPQTPQSLSPINAKARKWAPRTTSRQRGMKKAQDFPRILRFLDILTSKAQLLG